ncbi:hypothetical protein ACQX2R_11535, partial [Corynebacterium diphtheriae]
MFKRSLASVAAVAIASGAVVAPANAVTVTVNNDMTCTFSLTKEEANLTGVQQTVTHSQEKAAHIKTTLVENQLSALAVTITKIEAELAKPGLDDEKRKGLMSELQEKKKRFAANHSFKEALEKCTADKGPGSKNPEDQGNPGAQGNPDDSKNPEDQGNPDDSKNPGAQGNPD